VLALFGLLAAAIVVIVITSLLASWTNVLERRLGYPAGG
jgi:hypothetical protein